MTKYFAALALVGLLAGCGGSGSSEPPSAASIAKQIGCERFRPISDEIGIREGGPCLGVRGIDHVTTFNNHGDLTSYLSIVAAMHLGGIYLTGNDWAINGHSVAALKAAQAKIGGDIQ